jgi:2-hydroxymuconate-semialdehyde hydrolase
VELMRERSVVAAGINVRFREEGSGSPVVFLHGGALGSSADVWERNLGPLADHGLRCIALDLPGVGGTDAPLEYTEAYRRRMVLDLLDAIGEERAGIVGHSSAGGLAVSLGFEQPDRITRVMVLGTHSLLPPLPAGEAAEEGEGGPRSGQPPTIADVRAVLEEQLFDHSLITPEVLEARLAVSTRRPRPPQRDQVHNDRAAEREKGIPLWQRLDQMPVPLSMIYGTNDRPSTAQRFALLRERYPSLDARLIERCGHIVQWDAAAEFVAAAGSFFAS